MALKQQIEIILFWRNQPISLNSLSESLSSNPAEVKKALMDLIREYELRESGLQISFKDNGYILEPKEEYMPLAENFIPTNLKIGSLRTLALIALKEPVKQTEIIETRGSGGYEHIKELVENNWIKKEQIANTFILSTTNAFKKHFRLSESGGELKEKLQTIIAEITQNKLKMTEEIEEVLN